MRLCANAFMHTTDTLPHISNRYLVIAEEIKRETSVCEHIICNRLSGSANVKERKITAPAGALPTNRELFRAALARGWTPADLPDAYKLARDFNSKITLREVLADAVEGKLIFPPPCDGQSLS